MLKLAAAVLRSRWMVVVAGFFIMAVSGSIYAFGVYSSALKQALHYNQKTLTTIGFFKDFGNIGIFAGIIADVFPAPVVLSIGVAFNTVGYLLIWLAMTHRIAAPSLWQMFLYITIAGNSIAFTHAGALVTCVKNFPLHRGMIVGLLKGFLGLSAAILTLIYRAIYGSHPTSFVLLIVYLPLAVIVVSMFFIRPLPAVARDGRIEDEERVFYRLLILELAVAGYLMVVILVQHTVGVSQAVNGVFAGALALLLCVPIAMVAAIELKKPVIGVGDTVSGSKNDEERGDKLDGPTAPVEDDRDGAPDGDPWRDRGGSTGDKLRDSSCHWDVQNGHCDPRPPGRIAAMLATPPIGQDFTVWQALIHPDFWLLSIASTAGLGAGLMLIDNLGQVGSALGYNADKTGTFVSLISIWNCLGRVGSGFLSELCIQRRGLARPFFFALALGISAMGYLAIALHLPGALFVGSILIGLCFGAQWSLLHIIVSEVFGLKYYGTLQSIIAMASPLGTYLLSVRVAGYLYDKEADRQRGTRGGAGGANVACLGDVCYKRSFLVMCAVCSVGCLLALVMSVRTRKFYKTEVFEKLNAKRIELQMAKAKEANH